MPGPTAASVRGDGSNANVKMNAATNANASVAPSVSRVRASIRTSFA